MNRSAVNEYAVITLGTFLVGLAVIGYMEPCHIITGSVSGLALVIKEVLPLSVPTITLILNIICLLAGFCFLGQKFGVRSLYVSVLLPLCMKLVPVLLNGHTLAGGSMLRNTVMFLMILTAGQCLLFASDTASGGLDTIAEIISKKTHISRGNALGMCGIACSFAAVMVYGLQTAVFGAVVTVINGKLINLIMEYVPVIAGAYLHCIRRFAHEG